MAKRGIKWRGTGAVSVAVNRARGENPEIAAAVQSRGGCRTDGRREEEGGPTATCSAFAARAETLTPKGGKGGDRARKLSNE